MSLFGRRFSLMCKQFASFSSRFRAKLWRQERDEIIIIAFADLLNHPLNLFANGQMVKYANLIACPVNFRPEISGTFCLAYISLGNSIGCLKFHIFLHICLSSNTCLRYGSWKCLFVQQFITRQQMARQWWFSTGKFSNSTMILLQEHCK